MTGIEQWGPIAVQIPVVVTFVVFTTWMLKAFLAHLQHVAKTNTELLEIERKQRSEAMQTGLREVSVLCTAMEKLALAITENTRSITSHNAEATARHTHLLDAIRETRSRG